MVSEYESIFRGDLMSSNELLYVPRKNPGVPDTGRA